MRRNFLLLGFALAAVTSGTAIAQQSTKRAPQPPVTKLFTSTPAANVCMAVLGDRTYYVETAYDNGWLAVRYLDHVGADTPSSAFLNLAQIKMFYLASPEECSRLH